MKKTPPPKDEKDAENWLTRSEAAEEFGVSLVTIDNWARSGAPCEERDGRRVFPQLRLTIWKEFYDHKSHDREFAEKMKQPLKSIIQSNWAHFHFDALAWLTLNGHRNRSEIKKRLLRISVATDEIKQLL